MGHGKCFSCMSTKSLRFVKLEKHEKSSNGGPWTMEGSLMYLVARSRMETRESMRSDRTGKIRGKATKVEKQMERKSKEKRICQHMYALYLHDVSRII